MLAGPPIDRDIYCLKCFYCLRGLLDDRCPECGAPFDRSDSATFSSEPEGPALRQAIRALSRYLRVPDRPPQVLLAELRRMSSTGALQDLQADHHHLQTVHGRLIELLRERLQIPDSTLQSLLAEAEEFAQAQATPGFEGINDELPAAEPEELVSEDLLKLARALREDTERTPMYHDENQSVSSTPDA